VIDLKNSEYIPSFDNLSKSKFYPQNLPSILCAKILDPKENELILDMCAAPGTF
jgi:16S rRNA C967 or C1407 C5-methylase (RsmB/RsmF family)